MSLDADAWQAAAWHRADAGRPTETRARQHLGQWAVEGRVAARSLQPEHSSSAKPEVPSLDGARSCRAGTELCRDGQVREEQRCRRAGNALLRAPATERQSRTGPT